MSANNPAIKSPQGTTRMIADYISTVTARNLPEEVITRAKCHLLDSIAAIVSGSRLKAGRLAVRFAESQGGTPQARVWGTDLRTTAINAALVNGIAAHADETDDSHLAGRFHPGCAVVPAAIAIAEHRHSSGEDVLKAVAAGYDIGARFSMALGLTAPRSGTHSTHSLGALFGASAAAGALMGFHTNQNISMLSYAIQQASGIPYWERDSEHVEKAFDFGGMGARNGVFAAIIVDAGFSGVQDPLEGPNNYLSAFAEQPCSDTLVSELGVRFEICQATIKKWCVGSPIQAALDATEVLLSEGLQVEEIERIELTMPDDRLMIVDNRDMPDVCLQHLVAVCLIDGGLTFNSSHDRERMSDPQVLELRKMIKTIPSAELTVAKPARQAIVEVITQDGRRFRHHTKAVRGTPENPMHLDNVSAKAIELLAPVIGEEYACEMDRIIRELETVDNISHLAALASGPDN